jgi:translation initiation factor 1A
MYQSRIRNSKQRSKGGKGRVLLEPDEDQDYGIVQDMLGNGRLRATCSDGTVRVGRIRGSMRKYAGKVIIEKGDLILVSKREFGDDKVDVFHKYTHEEVSKLLRSGCLPEKIVKTLTHSDMETGDIRNNPNNDYIVFMEDDDNDEGEEPQGHDQDDSDEDIDIDAI